jgi:hypothetical protein
MQQSLAAMQKLMIARIDARPNPHLLVPNSQFPRALLQYYHSRGL